MASTSLSKNFTQHIHDFSTANPKIMFMCLFFFFFFLVGYVEERLCWPIQSPNIERKKRICVI